MLTMKISGQLGNGNFEDQKTPVQVLGLAGKNVIDIKNGYDHILALTDDGLVYCWGANDFGKIIGKKIFIFKVNQVLIQIV